MPDFLGLYKQDDDEAENATSKTRYSDAVKGLSGLIVLGDAWQSVDIFNALAMALHFDGSKSSPAYMSRLRACELVDDGRKSTLPNAPGGAALKNLLLDEGSPTYLIQKGNIPALEKKFKELRQAADAWHAQRTAYMMERLKAGRHPDTDETFWNDWREPPTPSLDVSYPMDDSARWEQYLRFITIGFGVIGVLCVSFLTLRFAKKRKTAGD